MFGRIPVALLCGVFALALVEAGTKILGPEKDLFAQTGKSFKLKCRHDDPTREGVLWYHNGKPINAEKDSNFVVYADVEEEAGGSVTYSYLTKNEVVKDDQGNYECRPKRGQSGSGFMRSVRVFTVIVEEEGSNRVKRQTSDKIEPVDAVYESGKDATLGCKVVSEDFVQATFRWHRAKDEDKTELAEGDKYKINQEEQTGNITIKKTNDNDVGQYICSFKIDDNEYEGTVSLNSVPIVENFESESKNLVQGDPLTVNCKVISQPAPAITWYRDDKPLDTSDPRVKLSEHGGLANASLRIEDLQFEDRAVYMCSAMNEIGTGNNTIMVRVKETSDTIRKTPSGGESSDKKLSENSDEKPSRGSLDDHKLAALWPFLGICAEVVILCTIIFIYEKRRAKKMEEEDLPEEAGHLQNSGPTHTTTRERRRLDKENNQQSTQL